MAQPPARTAINQSPSGGRAYPLVEYSELSEAILDFYLSYEDEVCRITLPITIRVTPGSSVTLVDAVGHPLGTFSFASAQATSWGLERVVYQWQTATTVVRVVVRTASMDVLTVNEGTLDPRTCNRLALRVRSLRTGLQRFAGSILLEDGFNVAMAAVLQSRTDGGRLVTRITVSASAGGGKGQAPGCEEAEVLVRRINGIHPDSAGNFTIEFDDCFRPQLPVLITDQEGRRVASYGSINLAADKARSAVVLHSDCHPCCECDYFVKTYKGLKRVHGFWAGTAAEGGDVRDQYSDNRDRWLASLDCRSKQLSTLTLANVGKGKSTVGAVFCNNTSCCLTPTQLWFTHQVYDDLGNLVDPSTLTGEITTALVNGSSVSGDTEIAMDGVWPVFLANIDYTDPTATAAVSYRLAIKTVATGWSVKVTLSVHAPQPPGCAVVEMTIPADILAYWADSGVEEPLYPARSVVDKSVPLMIS